MRGDKSRNSPLLFRHSGESRIPESQVPSLALDPGFRRDDGKSYAVAAPAPAASASRRFICSRKTARKSMGFNITGG